MDCIYNKAWYSKFKYDNKYVSVIPHNFDQVSLQYYINTEFKDFPSYLISSHDVNIDDDIRESEVKFVQIAENDEFYQLRKNLIINNEPPSYIKEIEDFIKKIDNNISVYEENLSDRFKTNDIILDKNIMPNELLYHCEHDNLFFMKFENGYYVVGIPDPLKMGFYFQMENDINLLNKINLNLSASKLSPLESKIKNNYMHFIENEINKQKIASVFNLDIDLITNKINKVYDEIVVKPKNKRLRYTIYLLHPDKSKNLTSIRDLQIDHVHMLESIKNNFIKFISSHKYYGKIINSDNILLYTKHPYQSFVNRIIIITEFFHSTERLKFNQYAAKAQYQLDEIISNLMIPNYYSDITLYYNLKLRYNNGIIISKQSIIDTYKLYNEYSWQKILNFIDFYLYLNDNNDSGIKDFVKYLRQIPKESYLNFIQDIYDKFVATFTGSDINYLKDVYENNILDYIVYWTKNIPLKPHIKTPGKCYKGQKYILKCVSTDDKINNILFDEEISKLIKKCNENIYFTNFASNHNIKWKTYIQYKICYINTIINNLSNISNLSIRKYVELKNLNIALNKNKIMNLENKLINKFNSMNELKFFIRVEYMRELKTNLKNINNILLWLKLIYNKFNVIKFQSSTIKHHEIIGYYNDNKNKSYQINLKPRNIPYIYDFYKKLKNVQIFKTHDIEYSNGYITDITYMDYYFPYDIEEYTDVSYSLLTYDKNNIKIASIDEPLIKIKNDINLFESIKCVLNKISNIDTVITKLYDPYKKWIIYDYEMIKKMLELLNINKNKRITDEIKIKRNNNLIDISNKQIIELIEKYCYTTSDGNYVLYPNKNTMFVGSDMIINGEFSNKSGLKNEYENRVKYPYFVAWWIPLNMNANKLNIFKNDVYNHDEHIKLVNYINDLKLKKDLSNNWIHYYKFLDYSKNLESIMRLYFEGIQFMKEKWNTHLNEMNIFMHDLPNLEFTTLHVHFMKLFETDYAPSYYSGREKLKYIKTFYFSEHFDKNMRSISINRIINLLLKSKLDNKNYLTHISSEVYLTLSMSLYFLLEYKILNCNI
jgi:hypothetical protein